MEKASLLFFTKCGCPCPQVVGETVFFAVKIEGAGGFLVAGTFFYCMAALWKLTFAFLVIGAVCAV